MTKQVEYVGDVLNLLEKLSDLPAGGQVLMGPLTYQRIYGRLEELRLAVLQKAYAFSGPPGGRLRSQRQASLVMSWAWGWLQLPRRNSQSQHSQSSLNPDEVSGRLLGPAASDMGSAASRGQLHAAQAPAG